MAIKRLKTVRAPVRGSDAAVLIQDGENLVRINLDDLATHDTPEKLLSEAGRQLGFQPNLHFHINRDGSIAVAYGVAPVVWPEDEV